MKRRSALLRSLAAGATTLVAKAPAIRPVEKVAVSYRTVYVEGYLSARMTVLEKVERLGGQIIRVSPVVVQHGAPNSWKPNPAFHSYAP